MLATIAGSVYRERNKGEERGVGGSMTKDEQRRYECGSVNLCRSEETDGSQIIHNVEGG